MSKTEFKHGARRQQLEVSLHISLQRRALVQRRTCFLCPPCAYSLVEEAEEEAEEIIDFFSTPRGGVDE
jgi:hypothetical protein